MKTELTFTKIKELIQIDGINLDYNSGTQTVEFTAKEEDMLMEINDWLLDYFPHYMPNISYGINNDGRYYLSLICIRMGAASSKGDWVDGEWAEDVDSLYGEGE